MSTIQRLRTAHRSKRETVSRPRSAPVGITMGDPAGIGPEVVLKALKQTTKDPEFRTQREELRVIGCQHVFELEQKRLGTRVDLSVVDDLVKMPGRWKMGRIQASCGRAAFAALETGVRLLRQGVIRALVTAPVSKESLRLVGFSWSGQTEFLAEQFGAQHYAMLAWTPNFKAVFVTIHLPLARVPRHITAAAVCEKAVLLSEFLKKTMRLGKRRRKRRVALPSCLSSRASPRIGVMAFNPHAYEFSLGEEERIAEGIRLARKAGVNAYGPIPADAALAGFSSARGPCFDGYVAMYHDQAMIPAKLLGRNAGVNITLGLPCVRTSPLHGTAFGIAGRGIADPGSMVAAIRLAHRLSRA
ncbi:MAG: 4-hydroxythreonine-4-phosphate dehydrogenase PdxA [candidate division WOR-3 bacterium]